jgi:hypothetical protein
MHDRISVDSNVASQKVFRLRIVRSAEHLADKDLAAAVVVEIHRSAASTSPIASRFVAQFSSEV